MPCDFKDFAGTLRVWNVMLLLLVAGCGLMGAFDYLNKMSHRRLFLVFGPLSVITAYLLFTNCYMLYGNHCFYIP